MTGTLIDTSRQAGGWHARSMDPTTCARRCWREPGPVRPDAHREADDLRAGPRAWSLQTCRTSAQIVRDAGARRLPVLVHRDGHRRAVAAFQMRAQLPPVKVGEQARPVAQSGPRPQGAHPCISSPRSICPAAPCCGASGATLALPLLDAMIPAGTALAQTAAAPKPHMGFIYFPHGAVMDQWTPAGDGQGFQALAHPHAAGRLPEADDRGQQPRQPAGRERRGARHRAGHLAVLRASAREPGCPTAASPSTRSRPSTSARTRRCRRWKSRTETAAGGGSTCDRAYGCSYSGTIVLPHADHAAADGEQSAQLFQRLFGHGDTPEERKALGEPVRPASWTWCRAMPRPCSASWGRAIARCSATTWTPCARSSGACRRWRSRAICRKLKLPAVPVGTSGAVPAGT